MGYIAFTDRQPGGWSLNNELLKVQDTIPICPPVISQHVALGALSAGKPWVQGKLASVERNREAVEVMSLASFSSFLDHFAHIFQLCTTPHAPWYVIYVVCDLLRFHPSCRTNKCLFSKKPPTSAQLWLSGQGFAPHCISGALIPMPCQPLFA